VEKKMRFGAGFWGAYPLGRYIEYATIAEDWGFDAAWIGDTQLVTPDLYSTMALCANATSTILIALFIGRDIKGSLEAFGREVLPVWRKPSAVSVGSSG
jgi:hypothetical protein